MNIETTNRYRILLCDGIHILEVSRPRWDMIDEVNMGYLGIRISMVHNLIERTLKALIFDKAGVDLRNDGLDDIEDKLKAIEPEIDRKLLVRGKGEKRTFLHSHDLPRLLKAAECVDGFCDYMKEAFIAAVKFYRFDTKDERMRHLVSLYDYLDKTGDNDHYSEMRYLGLERGRTKDSSLIDTSYNLHYEILWGLREWVISSVSLEGRRRKSNRRKTVSDRIDKMVRKHLTHNVHHFLSDSGNDEKLSHDYLRECRNDPLGVMERAIKSDFRFDAENHIRDRCLKEAYKELTSRGDLSLAYLLNRWKMESSEARSVLSD